MIRRIPPVLLFVLLVAALSACRATPTPLPAPVTIRLGGSEAMAGLMQELANAYHELHPYVTLTVEASDSNNGLRQLGLQALDVALVSRRVQADELVHRPGRVIEIARDGIVLVVHPSNSLTNVSRLQVGQIFSGEIVNWSELKIEAPEGIDPIQSLSREGGSGTRTSFEELLMTGRRVTLAALIRSSERDILSYVEAHPNSIGYVSFAALQTDSPPHGLSVDGIAPTLENLQSATYPLMRPLYLVVPDDSRSDVSAFVDFTQSPQAKAIIANRALPSPSSPH